ncbi:MAG: hypothetical protein ACRDY6_11910, partial [Acidimicrobiia bacterium]
MLTFLTLTILGNLAATLRQMHLPGGVSGSVTNVASPLTSDDSATEIVQSWRAWDDYRAEIEALAPVAEGDRREVSAPVGSVVLGWLVIDSLVLAPLLALLLYSSAVRRKAFRSPRWTPWLERVPVFAAVYLAADEAENAATAGFVFDWHGAFWLVRLLSGLKLAAFVLAAAPIVVALVSLVVRSDEDHRPGVAPLRPLLLRLRAPLVTVALVAAVVVFLPGNVRPQLDDVVRSWVPGDRLHSLWWALGMLAALTVALWAAGSLALRRSEREPGVPRPREWRLVLAQLAAAAAIVVVSVAVEKATSLDLFWPAGLVVGAGWVVYTGLGLILTGRPEVRAADPTDGRRLLGACVGAPALLFAALLLRSTDL